MKKVLALCLVAAMSLMMLVGCGGDKKSDDKIKVKFVVGGNRGDQSFVDSTWSGVERAGKELGVEASANELGGDKSKYESGIITAAEENNVVVCTGMEMLAIVNKKAKDFKDTKFIVADIDKDAKIEEPNVIGIHYKQNEADFLAGAVAAMKSKSGVIGFVGGMDVLVINDFLVGYIEGAKAVNPKIKVAVNYVGSFSDGPKGGEYALTQINNKKVDVIHPVAGGSGIGVLEKAAEKKIWAIGVDSDQYAKFKDSKPDVAKQIVTSALKNVGDSVFAQIKNIKENKFKADGKGVVILGIKDDAVKLVENDQFKTILTKEELAKYEQLKKDVSDGKINISTAYGKTAKEIKDIIDSVQP